MYQYWIAYCPRCSGRLAWIDRDRASSAVVAAWRAQQRDAGLAIKGTNWLARFAICSGVG